MNVNRLNYINAEKYDIPSGDYKLAFQSVGNSRAKSSLPRVEKSLLKGDYIVETIRIKDYTGPDLMISDLIFSREINILDIDEKTNLENLFVKPYPFANIDQKKQLIYISKSIIS